MTGPSRQAVKNNACPNEGLASIHTLAINTIDNNSALLQFLWNWDATSILITARTVILNTL